MAGREAELVRERGGERETEANEEERLARETER
jgi:hypothetical protein